MVGAPIAIPVDGPNSITVAFDEVRSQPIVVANLLGGDQRRLGYAVADDQQKSAVRGLRRTRS